MPFRSLKNDNKYDAKIQISDDLNDYSWTSDDSDKVKAKSSWERISFSF